MTSQRLHDNGAEGNGLAQPRWEFEVLDRVASEQRSKMMPVVRSKDTRPAGGVIVVARRADSREVATKRPEKQELERNGPVVQDGGRTGVTEIVRRPGHVRVGGRASP